MAEYGSFPIWDVTDPIPDVLPPQALGLSPRLQEQINDWARRFDETLDSEYPPNSGFLTVHELEDFEAVGRSLAEAIQVELGSEFLVSYTSSAGVKN